MSQSESAVAPPRARDPPSTTEETTSLASRASRMVRTTSGSPARPTVQVFHSNSTDDSRKAPGSLSERPGPHRNRGSSMKLLLTSGGITNPSIEKALVELLRKPIAESNALCVPAAAYGSLDPV